MSVKKYCPSGVGQVSLVEQLEVGLQLGVRGAKILERIFRRLGLDDAQGLGSFSRRKKFV